MKARKQFSQTGYCHSISPALETKLNHDGYYSFHDSSYVFSGYPARMTLSNFRENYIFFDNNQFAIFSDNDRDYFVWGSYFVTDDTIKARAFATPPNVTWGKKEIWFKILNQQVIKRIGLAWEKEMSKSDLEKYQSIESNGHLICGRLIKSENLPDPNKSWLKKRKWFWCNEKEYKMWKSGLKANK